MPDQSMAVASFPQCTGIAYPCIHMTRQVGVFDQKNYYSVEKFYKNFGRVADGKVWTLLEILDQKKANNASGTKLVRMY